MAYSTKKVLALVAEGKGVSKEIAELAKRALSGKQIKNDKIQEVREHLSNPASRKVEGSNELQNG